MRGRTCAPFAGASLLVIAGAAGAQTQSVAATGAMEEDSSALLQEVIVTARRKEESMEDVPQSMNAVTADAVQRLNLLQFQDIASVVPGLTLSGGSLGYDSSASIRGVTFDRTSQTNPTVALYLNDAPVEAGMLFQSLFDVNQIEVLRGPQGTLHGESAPSGAITLATRKPDLENFEVTTNVTGQSSDRFAGPFAYNTQAALNAPIIRDILAVRLAGVYDSNDYDGTQSVHNSAEPFSRTKAGRITATFQPADAFDMTASYQHLQQNVRNYVPVVGAGAPGGNIPGTNTPAPAAGYNGPSIGGDERLSVMDTGNNFTQKFDIVTGQANWHFGGQKLSYVGSYTSENIIAANGEDTGNLLPGMEFFQTQDTVHRQETHELRLSSEERIAGIFDYTAGFFYSAVYNHAALVQPASFLSGSFGSPLGLPSPSAYDSKYTLPVYIDAPGHDSERSVFVSETAYLGNRTELTAGARWIDYHTNDLTTLKTGSADIALPSQAILPPGVPCGAAGFSSTYAGTCDIPLAPATVESLPNRTVHKPIIYQISISHHFSDELMAYANTGTAWRPGPAVVGVTNGRNDPTLSALTYLHSEYSHSYEIGIKEMFFDRRAYVNLAVYHQYFDGLIFVAQPAPYLQYTNSASQPTLSNSGFDVNANSVVNGVDLDAAFRVTPHWNVSSAVSYADGHVDNASVPCIPAGFDGQSVASFQAAVAAAGKPGALVYLCKSSQAISTAPSWNATLQSEYTVPFGKTLDGFVRGLLDYYPRNPNTGLGYVVPSYALANLYFGVRSDGWEATVFAKNLGDRFVRLSRSYTPIVEGGGLGGYFGSTGYYGTSFTQPLQVGLNLRYSFGTH